MSCKFVKQSTNPFRVRHFMSFAVNPPLAKQLNFARVNIYSHWFIPMIFALRYNRES